MRLEGDRLIFDRSCEKDKIVLSNLSRTMFVLIVITLFVSTTMSGSHDSHGGSRDSADWRFNHVLLPLWNERPLCKCGRVATIDTWDIGVSDLLVGRWYFKCPDHDEDFVV
jgi:hypothetical protein